MQRASSLALFSACALWIAACSSTPPGSTPDAPGVGGDGVGDQARGDMNGAPEHVAPTRDARPGGVNGSPLMVSHGGNVLSPTTKTEAIFWGTEWSSASFAGDKIDGIDSFFTGYGGSNYAGASTEYAGNNGQVTRDVQYLGHVLDTRAAPTKALSTSSAVAEACRITNNAPDPLALYLIYTSTGAGHVNYCAWHSYGTCSNGAPVQVAYMPNIDGIAGCDPGDTSGLHSQGLAALANVTAHELSETITDPRNGGWYDSSGNENGDKCAWSFFTPVLLRNGSTWKLQMEWSNAAYTANAGHANRSGQNGCLQGECDPGTAATVCVNGACGSQPDGCGGTIDCGTCP